MLSLRIWYAVHVVRLQFCVSRLYVSVAACKKIGGSSKLPLVGSLIRVFRLALSKRWANCEDRLLRMQRPAFCLLFESSSVNTYIPLRTDNFT